MQKEIAKLTTTIMEAAANATFAIEAENDLAAVELFMAEITEKMIELESAVETAKL